MYCMKCGTQLPDEAQFCWKCGDSTAMPGGNTTNTWGFNSGFRAGGLILQDAGRNKIAVIKVVRELTNWGLKEAKDLVDAAPTPFLRNESWDRLQQAKELLERVGATVRLE